MKKTIAALVCACLLLVTVGCGDSSFDSYTTLMSVSAENGDGFSMTYRKFNGTRRYDIDVAGSEAPLTVNVGIVTEGGELSVTIKKKEAANAAYTGEKLTTQNFTVDLTEAGTYVVTVTAKDHVGSYKFDWGKK